MRDGRLAARRLIVAVAVAVTWLAAALPATAQTSAETPPSKEAWYRTPLVGGGEDPACSSPAGCPFQPATPADPYPEDTLHVGALAGRQDSATFLRFDLSGVPDRAELTGGTVILPVASQDSGTSRPDAASMVACLVVEPFAPARGGGPEGVPSVDCDTSAEAVYDADADPARFTVDLTSFVQRWTAGERNYGIGLLAAEDSEETQETQENWHVAFSATGREGDVAPPPTAVLTFTPPPVDGLGDGSVTAPPASGTTGSDPAADDGSAFVPQPPPASSSVGGAPQLSTAQPPAPAREEAAPPPVTAPPDTGQAPTAIAAPRPAGYAYPAVWLLPLVLLVGAGSLVRTLGAEVEVVTDAAQRDLPSRLWLAFFPSGDRGGV